MPNVFGGIVAGISSKSSLWTLELELLSTWLVFGDFFVEVGEWDVVIIGVVALSKVVCLLRLRDDSSVELLVNFCSYRFWLLYFYDGILMILNIYFF